MYDRDVPSINTYARATPDGLVDVALFAVLSIQRPFFVVPREMQHVRKYGVASLYLWGWKANSYTHLHEHKDTLWTAVCEASTPNECIEALVTVPGLGMVKAGFVAQMLGHDTACIDTRNKQVLGLGPNAFAFPKDAKQSTKRNHIASYVQFTQRTGGARHWWNTWCNGLANAAYSADDISRLHTTTITGDYNA